MKTTGERFDEMVKSGKKIYLSRNPFLKNHLIQVKSEAAKSNANLTPYVDDRGGSKCNTCGSVNLAHPITSYCFVCDTDNWEAEYF